MKIYNFGGKCPVQADINYLGYYGYFRARYDTASIEFSNSEKDWENGNVIYADYNLIKTEMGKAGWLPKWKCKLLIYKGLLKFTIYLIKNL